MNAQPEMIGQHGYTCADLDVRHLARQRLLCQRWVHIAQVRRSTVLLMIEIRRSSDPFLNFPARVRVKPQHANVHPRLPLEFHPTDGFFLS